MIDYISHVEIIPSFIRPYLSSTIFFSWTRSAFIDKLDFFSSILSPRLKSLDKNRRFIFSSLLLSIPPLSMCLYIYMYVCMHVYTLQLVSYGNPSSVIRNLWIPFFPLNMVLVYQYLSAKDLLRVFLPNTKSGILVTNCPVIFTYFLSTVHCTSHWSNSAKCP